MKKRSKKYRKEDNQLVQAIRRARKYGEKASVPWKQGKFEYVLGDNLNSEQKGRLRVIVEL